MKHAKKKPKFFDRIIEWLAKEAEEHNADKPIRKMPLDKEIEHTKRRIPGA